MIIIIIKLMTMISRFSGTSQWDLCLLVGRLGVKELASLSHSSQGFHHSHRHHHLLHRHHRRHRCHRHDDGKQVRSWGLYVHCKQRSGTSSTRHNHFIGSMWVPSDISNSDKYILQFGHHFDSSLWVPAYHNVVMFFILIFNTNVQTHQQWKWLQKKCRVGERRWAELNTF